MKVGFILFLISFMGLEMCFHRHYDIRLGNFTLHHNQNIKTSV